MLGLLRGPGAALSADQPGKRRRAEQGYTLYRAWRDFRAQGNPTPFLGERMKETQQPKPCPVMADEKMTARHQQAGS